VRDETNSPVRGVQWGAHTTAAYRCGLHHRWPRDRRRWGVGQLRYWLLRDLLSFVDCVSRV